MSSFCKKGANEAKDIITMGIRELKKAKVIHWLGKYYQEKQKINSQKKNKKLAKERRNIFLQKTTLGEINFLLNRTLLNV